MNPKTLIVDALTGETIEREMTDEEMAALADVPNEYINENPLFTAEAPKE